MNFFQNLSGVAASRQSAANFLFLGKDCGVLPRRRYGIWKKALMKTIILLCGLLVSTTALAQTYNINWSKIAGGGGIISTGGVYSVAATAGQHDAGGPMTGGNFSVTGGFWSLISVEQTPGAPLLTITRVGNAVVVSWPSSETGWVLQQNSNLGTANWTISGYTVNDDGTIKSIIIPSTTGSLFFRLSH